MGLVIRNETVGDAACDRCQQEASVHSAEKTCVSGIIEEFRTTQGWRIRRHRGDTPDEAVCGDCVKREADEKRAKKARLCVLAGKRNHALAEYKEEREKLLMGKEAPATPESENTEPTD